jgi:glutamyl-tRNA reductase
MTDETLERRKQFIPQAESIIEDIKRDFIQWLETRKFAPVIKALKKKLNTMKEEELDYQSKKIFDFNSEQADVISNRIIQKITKQFANHLKHANSDADESLELIQKVFQLEINSR